MKEIFMSIKGYEDTYAVSNLGRVKKTGGYEFKYYTEGDLL